MKRQADLTCHAPPPPSRLNKMDESGKRVLRNQLVGQLPGHVASPDGPMQADVATHDLLNVVLASQAAHAPANGSYATVSCLGVYGINTGTVLQQLDYSANYERRQARASPRGHSCGTCCVYGSEEHMFLPSRVLLPSGLQCFERGEFGHGECTRWGQFLYVLGRQGSQVQLRSQRIVAAGAAVRGGVGSPEVSIDDAQVYTLDTSPLSFWAEGLGAWAYLSTFGDQSVLLASYPARAGRLNPGLAGTYLDVQSAEVLALSASSQSVLWRLSERQPDVVAVLGNSVASQDGYLHIPVLVNASAGLSGDSTTSHTDDDFTTSSHTSTPTASQASQAESRRPASLLQVRLLKVDAATGREVWWSSPLVEYRVHNLTAKRSLLDVPALVAAWHPSAILLAQRELHRPTSQPSAESIGLAALGHSSGTIMWQRFNISVQAKYDAGAPNGISLLPEGSPGGTPLSLRLRVSGHIIADDRQVFVPLAAYVPLNLSHPTSDQATLALGVLSATVLYGDQVWQHFITSTPVGSRRSLQAGSSPQLSFLPSLIDIIVFNQGRLAVGLNLAEQHQLAVDGTSLPATDDVPDDDLPVLRQNGGVEITALGCPKSPHSPLLELLRLACLGGLLLSLVFVRGLCGTIWAFSLPPGVGYEGDEDKIASGPGGNSAPWWAGLSRRERGRLLPGGGKPSCDTLCANISLCHCPSVPLFGTTSDGRQVRGRSPTDVEAACHDDMPGDEVPEAWRGPTETLPLRPQAFSTRSSWRDTSAASIDEGASRWQAACRVCLGTLAPCWLVREDRSRFAQASAIRAVAHASRGKKTSSSMSDMMRTLHCTCDAHGRSVWCGCAAYAAPASHDALHGCRWGRVSCVSTGRQNTGVPWVLLSFFTLAISASFVLWFSVRAIAAVQALQREIADPYAFYRTYVIDRAPVPGYGCATPLLGACFCEGSVSGADVQQWSQPSPASDADCSADVAAVPSIGTCTLACSAVLRDTGNCGSSVWHYTCGCGTPEQEYQDSQLELNETLGMRTPGLPGGLSQCHDHYTTMHGLLLSTMMNYIVLCMIVAVGMLWGRLPLPCAFLQLGRGSSPRPASANEPWDERPDSSASKAVTNLSQVCPNQCGVVDWVQFAGLLFMLSLTLLSFWGRLLVQDGRVCSGADGDAEGSSPPLTGNSIDPAKSLILEHIGGCTLGAAWTSVDLEGHVLQDVAALFAFNLSAAACLAADFILAGLTASIHVRGLQRPDLWLNSWGTPWGQLRSCIPISCACFSRAS